jgi:hypothetical protein
MYGHVYPAHRLILGLLHGDIDIDDVLAWRPLRVAGSWTGTGSLSVTMGLCNAAYSNLILEVTFSYFSGFCPRIHYPPRHINIYPQAVYMWGIGSFIHP